MVTMPRDYDIVVLGATGFFGRRCVIELLTLVKDSPKYRLAIAGRSAERLEKLLLQLDASDKFDVIGDIDAADTDCMEEIAASTSVLLSAVSNFTELGNTIVQSCARHGTHYFDISLEVGVTEDLRTLYDKLAVENECIICTGAGFNFAMADLATSSSTSMMQTAGFIPLNVESTLEISPGKAAFLVHSRLVLECSERFGRMWWRRGPTPCQVARQQVRNKALPGTAELTDENSSAVDCTNLAGLRFNEILGCWAIEGNGCESAVVHRSQAAMCTPPTNYAAFYRNMVALPACCNQLMISVVILAAAFFRMLCSSMICRKVLSMLLRLFNGHGITTDDSRFEQSIKGWTFRMVFTCEGAKNVDAGSKSRKWGRSVSIGADSYSRERVGYIGRKLLTTEYTGPSPLYVITPMSLALAGFTCLQEIDDISARGFCTPAMVFASTSFFETLKDKAGIKTKETWIGG